MAQAQADYLDAGGVRPNFVSGQPYSDAYRQLAASRWSKLPLYSDPNKVALILASLRDHAVTVVISATGSGKSVIVPRLAMKHLMTRHGQARHGVPPSRLAMTFPKSILAMQSALYASRTWDVVLGQQVGYQYRGSPSTSHSSDTRALFLTDGTLYTMSRKDPLFSRFDLVIVDEAHERSVQTDLLLERLRAALLVRPELRLVIMSATIDPAIFTRYFADTGVVTVAGQPSFEITHHWEAVAVLSEAFLRLALQRAAQALSSGKGDVLVFVPTTKDATKGCKALRDSDLPVRGITLCEGLYRKLPDPLKEIVIHGRPVAPMTQKLVFATPIAESSMTLPSLGAVVDGGLQLSSTWLAGEQATRVTREMTSKAQIAQRVGRVGRVAPGDAYHLYTRAQYAMLREFPEPAILHTDLTEHFLAELCRPGKGVAGVLEDCARLISPPSSDQTLSALNTLRQLGLVLGDSITDMGRSAQDLVDMFKKSLSGALLLLGGALVAGSGTVRRDMIALACILEEVKGELSDLWSLSAVKDPRSPLRLHCDATSDHVSLVRVYREVYLGGRERERGALYLAVWDRIHASVTREEPRYMKFTSRTTSSSALLPAANSRPAFAVPLVRALAYARRHRQMVRTKKGEASAGPLRSCIATSRPLLALALTAPASCVGALYDELVEVTGSKAFSVVTWIS